MEQVSARTDGGYIEPCIAYVRQWLRRTNEESHKAIASFSIILELNDKADRSGGWVFEKDLEVNANSLCLLAQDLQSNGYDGSRLKFWCKLRQYYDLPPPERLKERVESMLGSFELTATCFTGEENLGIFNEFANME